MRRAFAAISLITAGLVTAALGHPGGGIAVDAKGRVYFTDTYKGVRVIDERGRETLAGGEAAHWLAVDESGRLADGASPGFGRATPRSESPAVLTNAESPCAIDADGAAYYLKGGDLVRQPPGGKAAALVGGADGRKKLRSVTGAAVGPRGSVYLMSMDGLSRGEGTDYHAVLKVGGDGTVTVVAENFVPGKGEPLAEVRWGYCRGLAVDESGAVFVAGTGSRGVYAVTPDGQVRTVLRADAPWSPTGVAVRGGAVYVLEYDHAPARDREWEPRVRKVGRDGGVTTLAHVRRDPKK